MHARNLKNRKYLTLVEGQSGIGNGTESTGLVLTKDNKHMYVSFQENVSMNSGDWMENGKAFSAALLTQSITQSHHKVCIGRRLLFLDWGTGLESIILAALVSLSIIRFVLGIFIYLY